MSSFNPRVLAGGRDILAIAAAGRVFSFNPRVLAGGRDVVRWFLFGLHWGFNPRVLAGGRDIDLPRDDGGLVVSIHASSREDATSAG